MSVFKLTVQYQTSDGYPVVAEFSQADRFPVRAERRLRLDEDMLLDLQSCGDSATYGKILGQTLLQGATAASIEFSDSAVADHFDRYADLQVQPARCGRIWIHSHPGVSHLRSPSVTAHIAHRAVGPVLVVPADTTIIDGDQ